MDWNPESLKWLGAMACLSQSAMFSGLNLALFGLSRLRLEVEADSGNKAARQLLEYRRRSNFLLATILWGNVAVNCLLTILLDSILAGTSAFLVSTVLITFCGEIVPQAYFSRHALRMFMLLSPLLRLYTILLYPVAKPSSLLLNAWLGPEGVTYYREQDLHAFLKKHISASEETGIGRIEGVGALNFLTFDDLPIAQEGEAIHPKSIIQLPAENLHAQWPPFPNFTRSLADPFVQTIQASGKKWAILVNQNNLPLLAIDSEAFFRGLFFDGDQFNPRHYCHRPLVVTDPALSFAKLLPQLKVNATHAEDDVIDHDLIILWAEEKRIITGSDILGRLLRGIVQRAESA